MEATGNERWQDVATAQHAAISIVQLEQAGVSERARRTLVRRGVLVAAAPRVFTVAGSPPTVAQHQHVGLLSLGPGAVLSHEAAARLHRFDGALPGVVEFTVVRPRRSCHSPFRVHSTLVLDEIDRTEVNGFPVTTPSRTIIDLAGQRTGKLRLEAAIDSAVRSGGTSPEFLLDRLSALRGSGRYGVRRLDELLLDAGGHTMLERRFLQLMREAGLPRPHPQVIQRRDGVTFARVDFYFEEHGVVVEVSGRKGHSSPSERANDARRRNALQDAGYVVYEFTWEDVTARPRYVCQTMADALARARLRRAG